MRKAITKPDPIQVVERSALLRYSVAVAVVILAAAARFALDPWMGEHTVFLPFTVAVLVSVVFGGRGPGLASAALSLLSAWYVFLAPRYSFAVASTWDRAALLEFAAVSLVIIEMSARLRQSLAATAESRATATALLDASAQAIIATTDDGRIALLNANTERIFGYSPGELLGQPHDRLIPERLRARHRQYHESFVSTPSPRQMSARANVVGRRKDGTEFPVEITLNSIESARGRLSVSFVSDITERRRMEEDFRRQYDLMSTITGCAAEGLILVDGEGRVKFVNPSAVHLLGWTAAELQDAVLHDRVHYHRSDGTPIHRCDCPLKNVVQTGKGIHGYETEFFRKDGTPVPVSISMAPILRDGRVFGAAVVVSDITEQKRVAEALREGEERFRVLFESMDEGFASCEMMYDEAGHAVDFRYLLVNPAFGKLTGLPVAKVCGRTVRELIPEIEPFWIETYDRIVRTGCGERIANPVAQLGRWFEVYAWRSGPGRFAVTFNDITDRRRTEQALSRLSELIDLSHDAVITGDADRVIRTWNAGAAELYGWTEAEAVGQVTHEFLQTRAEVTTAEQDAILQRRGRWDGELEHVAKDGTPLWVESRQVLGSSGDAPRFLEINRDITARKRSEKAMRESEERFRALVTASSDVIYHLSPDGTEMRQLTGRGFLQDTIEPTRDWLQKYVYPNDQARVMAAVDEALRTKQICEVEHRILRADGGVGWVHSRAVPIENEHGEIIEWFGAASDITQRKLAEQALRESQEQLELAIASANIGTWDLDPVSGQLKWCRRSKALFGLPPDAEVDYQTFLDRLHPDDRERVHNLVERALDPAGDGAYEAEYRSVWPDGAERWIVAAGKAFFGSVDGQARAVRFIGTVLDITARKQSEEVLRRSEEQRKLMQAAQTERQRFFDVLETLPPMVCLLTPDYHVAWANRSFRERFGTPNGRHCYQYCFGLTEPCDFCESYEVLKTGRPHRWEVNGADGSVIEAHDFPFTDVDGSPLILEMDIDITEQRRAETELNRHRQHLEELVTERTIQLQTANVQLEVEISERKETEDALRQSEQQFRTLANAIPQLCWMANADGWIFWYNQRWYEHTGTTPQQMEGWGWQSVHDPEELPHVLEHWKDSIATGKPLDMVFPLRGADGVFRPFLTRVMPLCDQEGKVVRWFGTNTDISAQRQAEEALRASEDQLRKLNEQLEQRVHDRTAQLEASNKELEAFAYSVSHDLRAPLRGIDGWSLALLEDYADRLDADGREQLSWVRSEAQRMGDMIEDLLRLSRVTRSPMLQGKVELTELAQTVAQRLRASVPDRSIAFQIRPGLSAWGDQHLLEIVLTNLLENAVKYTGRRAEARIEVGCASHRDAATFYVRDNGVGFNPAEADKLFTAFQRLHKPTEFPGIGIGLATVQRIIRRHGGRVWAEAVPDEGATFYFTLAQAHSTPRETT